jgi:hypothetical protein
LPHCRPDTQSIIAQVELVAEVFIGALVVDDDLGVERLESFEDSVPVSQRPTGLGAWKATAGGFSRTVCDFPDRSERASVVLEDATVAASRGYANVLPIKMRRRLSTPCSYKTLTRFRPKRPT